MEAFILKLVTDTGPLALIVALFLIWDYRKSRMMAESLNTLAASIDRRSETIEALTAEFKKRPCLVDSLMARVLDKIHGFTVTMARQSDSDR